MSPSPREIREIGSEGSPISLFSSFQRKLHINVIQTDLVKLSGSQDKNKDTNVGKTLVMRSSGNNDARAKKESRGVQQTECTVYIYEIIKEHH